MYLNFEHCDWWSDCTHKGIFDLNIYQDHPEDDIILELKLRGSDEDYSLETMNLSQYPELMDIYDFENKQWVESELSCFWSGLEICLA